jgi:hypothetical protein
VPELGTLGSVTGLRDEKARFDMIDRPAEADKKILGSAIKAFAPGRIALQDAHCLGVLGWP